MTLSRVNRSFGRIVQGSDEMRLELLKSPLGQGNYRRPGHRQEAQPPKGHIVVMALAEKAHAKRLGVILMVHGDRPHTFDPDLTRPFLQSPASQVGMSIRPSIGLNSGRRTQRVLSSPDSLISAFTIGTVSMGAFMNCSARAAHEFHVSSMFHRSQENTSQVSCN